MQTKVVSEPSARWAPLGSPAHVVWDICTTSRTLNSPDPVQSPRDTLRRAGRQRKRPFHGGMCRFGLDGSDRVQVQLPGTPGTADGQDSCTGTMGESQPEPVVATRAPNVFLNSGLSAPRSIPPFLRAAGKEERYGLSISSTAYSPKHFAVSITVHRTLSILSSALLCHEQPKHHIVSSLSTAP